MAVDWKCQHLEQPVVTVFLSRNHDADNDHTERQQIVGVEKGTLNKHGRPCLGVFRGKIRTQIGNAGADYQDRGNKNQWDYFGTSVFHQFYFKQFRKTHFITSYS